VSFFTDPNDLRQTGSRAFLGDRSVKFEILGRLHDLKEHGILEPGHDFGDDCPGLLIRGLISTAAGDYFRECAWKLGLPEWFL
jgi:hypothetical protein